MRKTYFALSEMDGPKQLSVKLKGEVLVKWTDCVGIYNISHNLANEKFYWVQETGENALWYDPKYQNWKIGWLSRLGGSKAKLLTQRNTASDLPHIALPWKYMKNGVWIGTDNIIVAEGVLDNLGLFLKDSFSNCRVAFESNK